MSEESAEKFLERLKGHLDTEKCSRCECLQGAFVQLLIDRPELIEAIDRVITDEVHGCLGCERCEPARIWAEYLKPGKD